jgi:hypothetical protein
MSQAQKRMTITAIGTASVTMTEVSGGEGEDRPSDLAVDSLVITTHAATPNAFFVSGGKYLVEFSRME